MKATPSSPAETRTGVGLRLIPGGRRPRPHRIGGHRHVRHHRQIGAQVPDDYFPARIAASRPLSPSSVHGRQWHVRYHQRPPVRARGQVGPLDGARYPSSSPSSRRSPADRTRMGCTGTDEARLVEERPHGVHAVHVLTGLARPAVSAEASTRPFSQMRVSPGRGARNCSHSRAKFTLRSTGGRSGTLATAYSPSCHVSRALRSDLRRAVSPRIRHRSG